MSETSATAVAFARPDPPSYSAAERQRLLFLARQAIEEAVLNHPEPGTRPEEYPARLAELKACFVTLTTQHRLRGCIGHLVAQEPLYRAVMTNARNAALHDARFLPLQPDELPETDIEISVLTGLQRLVCSSLEELLNTMQPHRDGIVMDFGNVHATYLPQVWAQVPDKIEFLDSLARKAGREASDWRLPHVQLSTYRVEAFNESEWTWLPRSLFSS